MTNYKLFKDRRGNDAGVVLVTDANTVAIPFDPANSDYQAFLKYQAEGGKVYGADEEVPDGQAAE